MSWRTHPLRTVLPVQMAADMLRRARQFDAEAGGRFTVRGSRTVVLWSAEAYPDGGREAPVASFRIAWGVPTSEKATIDEVAWDPERSSLHEACDAIAVLAGAWLGGAARG